MSHIKTMQNSQLDYSDANAVDKNRKAGAAIGDLIHHFFASNAEMQTTLLLFRHSVKCDCPTGHCQYSARCPETKDLWKHIGECRDTNCGHPGCQAAIQLLRHHHGCRQPCAVCSPVKTIMDSWIKKQPRQGCIIPGQEDWGSEETILDRMNMLHRTMLVLEHTSTCGDPCCTYDSCLKMKELFHHAVGCKIRAEGGCPSCRRLWGILQLHSRQCRLRPCSVPRCEDLRQMARNRQDSKDTGKVALDSPVSRRNRSIGQAGHMKELELEFLNISVEEKTECGVH